MKSAVVLALAAACGTPARHVEPAVAPPVVVPPPVVAAGRAAPPVVRPDVAQGGTEAPPAGAIQLLAATPDGGAVITADELRGVRLWPALDGSAEPRIVLLPEPHQLALGRRGGGFTAAVLDAAGGLYIASLDAQGKSRSHVSLPAEPAYLGIAMAAGGLVAWRADQTVVLLGGDGATLGQLATSPGERIVTVEAGGAHVAALLERGGKRGVREVVLADRPAWGAWIELGSEAADRLAVAPSGRLAVRDGKDVVVLEAGGKLVARMPGGIGDALGFVDDTHVVVATSGALLWLTPGEQAGKTRDIATGQLAVGGGHAISATGGDLMIATPTGAHYLGYDLESPAIAQPAGDGRLVIGLGATFLALDAQLRAAGSLGVAMPEDAQVSDLRWLGGDAWVVEASRPDDTRSSLLLVAGGTTKVVRKDLAVAHVLAYEPSTQLVTLSLGDAPSVYKFDPVKRELSRVAVVADAGAYAQTELVPLAPARAGGAQLLHVTLRDTTTLEWLPDATKLGKPSAKVSFTGSIAAADASGHAYGWVTTSDSVELAVFLDGKRLRSLPADEPVSVWPDATGAHVAVIGTHGVSLVTGDGKRVWTKQLEHATEALWLSDGALAVITAAGIARIATATGAVTAARCGWGFGLAAKPHPPPSRVEPVCAQLEPGD